MSRILACILSLMLLTGVGTTIKRSLADECRLETAAEEDQWRELMQRAPYPYTTPIPAEIATIADGSYVKFEPHTAPPIPCRRCPDYKPTGGWWKISLHKGVFRIYHPASGWKSLGTFAVAGQWIKLFNDPVCPELTGTYRWVYEQESIRFTAVEDRCAAGLRARNLTRLPWQSCSSRAPEAADSGLGSPPEGCGQR